MLIEHSQNRSLWLPNVKTSRLFIFHHLSKLIGDYLGLLFQILWLDSAQSCSSERCFCIELYGASHSVVTDFDAGHC